VARLLQKELGSVLTGQTVRNIYGSWKKSQTTTWDVCRKTL